MSLNYQNQHQRLKLPGEEYPETLLEQGALHTYLPMIDCFHTNNESCMNSCQVAIICRSVLQVCQHGAFWNFSLLY